MDSLILKLCPGGGNTSELPISSENNFAVIYTMPQIQYKFSQLAQIESERCLSHEKITRRTGVARRRETSFSASSSIAVFFFNRVPTYRSRRRGEGMRRIGKFKHPLNIAALSTCWHKRFFFFFSEPRYNNVLCACLNDEY